MSKGSLPIPRSPGSPLGHEPCENIMEEATQSLCFHFPLGSLIGLNGVILGLHCRIPTLQIMSAHHFWWPYMVWERTGRA